MKMVSITGNISLVVRLVFSLELLLGGQARVTSWLTPAITKQAMAKAQGYREHLPIIPSKTPHAHSCVIGCLMLIAGFAMIWPWPGPIRMSGTILGTSLALMGVYSQRLMEIPYWLPCINACLGVFVLVSEAAVW